jgi:hypothetical protein
MKELASKLSYRLMIVMACLAMGTAFVGCGDDDDPGNTEDDAGAGRGGSDEAGRGGRGGSDEAGRGGRGGSDAGRGGTGGMDPDEDAGMMDVDAGDEDAG